MTSEEKTKYYLSLVEKCLILMLTVLFASIAYCFDYVLKNGPNADLIAVGTMVFTALAESIVTYALFKHIQYLLDTITR